MRRHTRIMLFMLLVMLLALTGCEKIYTGNADTQTSSDSEELTETVQETETNPETVRESVESDKVTEGSTQNKKVFESSLGYSVIYDDTVFEYNRTGDYDEIGLRGQTFSSKPVFSRQLSESRLTAQFASRQQKKWMAARTLSIIISIWWN